jgi:hypothetical protein
MSVRLCVEPVDHDIMASSRDDSQVVVLNPSIEPCNSGDESRSIERDRGVVLDGEASLLQECKERSYLVVPLYFIVQEQEHGRDDDRDCDSRGGDDRE